MGRSRQCDEDQRLMERGCTIAWWTRPHRISAPIHTWKRRNHSFFFQNFSLSSFFLWVPSFLSHIFIVSQEQYQEHMNVLPLTPRILIIIIPNFFLTQILPNHLFLDLKHKLGFKNPKWTQTLFFYSTPLNSICFLLVARGSIQNQIKCLTSISQTHNHQKF
jgi:hypothetical protein